MIAARLFCFATVFTLLPLAAGSVCLADEPETADPISVTKAKWKDVQKSLGQVKGKVIIVDFWSTSCTPCMVEFPNLVKLAEKHGDKVLCVSFNLDYAGIKSKPPEYYEPRVTKFLKSRKAAIRNYMSTEDALDVFDMLEINSVPAVFVYGKDGKLAKRFDGSLLKDGADEAFTYEADINPYVESLLK